MGKHGQILIVTIIFLAVIVNLSTSVFSRVASYLHFNSSSALREQAVHLAEGGVDYAVW